MPPLADGVASRALGLWQWTETKVQVDVGMKYLFAGPAYGP